MPYSGFSIISYMGKESRKEWIFGKDTYTVLHLKWIIHKDLVYSTWKSVQVMWQPGWEGSLVNGYMYMNG